MKPKPILLSRNLNNSPHEVGQDHGMQRSSNIEKSKSSANVEKKVTAAKSKKYVMLGPADDSFSKDSFYDPNTSTLSGVVERTFGKKNSCLLNAGSSIDRINLSSY